MIDVNSPTPEEPGSLAWRRRQLLIVSGLVMAVGGLGLYVVAHWGTLCVDDACWGEASGSAWPVGLGGAIVAGIGALIAITGFAVPAPAQVTLVPGGEVSLSGMRVQVVDADGPVARMRVGAQEVTCRQGERIILGDYAYDVEAVDPASHWVTLCPVPEEPVEAT
jgi:hypothetical protein